MARPAARCGRPGTIFARGNTSRFAVSLRAEPLEQRDAPALFSPGQAIGVGTWPIAVLSADFNGDGHADLAVANENDSTVSIFLGNGTGQFASAAGSPVSTVGAPSSLAAADVNGDGHLDLFVM